jgi:hypothetical protein
MLSLLSTPEKKRYGGATVFSGEHHRKTTKNQTFYIKSPLFYMLVPNPELKFLKSLKNVPDRR